MHGSGAAGASNGSGERAGQEREVSSTCIHPTVEIQLCKKSSDCKFWTTNGSFLERSQVILAQKRVRVCRVWSMGSTAGTGFGVWVLGTPAA